MVCVYYVFYSIIDSLFSHLTFWLSQDYWLSHFSSLKKIIVIKTEELYGAFYDRSAIRTISKKIEGIRTVFHFLFAAILYRRNKRLNLRDCTETYIRNRRKDRGRKPRSRWKSEISSTHNFEYVIQTSQNRVSLIKHILNGINRKTNFPRSLRT